jgi:methionyl-tRNA synthetase
VPVPLEGYEAGIGYPSIAANYTPDWELWRRDPDNVQLYQFLGKDNVSFHSGIFPGCQLGTGDKLTMLHHLSTTEYLYYENGKFSKSRGIGVFGNNAKQTDVPPDVWRYLKIRPERGDTQLEWRSFVDSNNGELLTEFGNLVNRVIKLVVSPKAYDSVVPEFTVTEAFTPFLN